VTSRARLNVPQEWLAPLEGLATPPLSTPAADRGENLAVFLSGALPALRLRLPLLTLGDYNPDSRTGPAIYLRSTIAGVLDDKPPAGGSVPIIYLPGVSRQELRAVEECPKPLQLLAELQYRGVIFSHKNGRDWTIAGFLQAPDGLGIAVGADAATREAMQRALLKLADEPLAHLRQQAPLRASFFDALLHPDDVRRLLKWLDDPQGYPTQLTAQEWQSFCALCRDKYAFTAGRSRSTPSASWPGWPSASRLCCATAGSWWWWSPITAGFCFPAACPRPTCPST
jgi:hypothetical protein